MEGLEHILSHIPSRFIIIYLSLLLLVSIIVSSNTPMLLIEYSSSIPKSSSTWIGSLTSLSTSNLILSLKITACSVSEAYLHIILSTYTSKSSLEGKTLHDISEFQSFPCENSLIFQTFITETKYILHVETHSIDSLALDLTYVNAEYTEFNILLKGILMQILIVSSIVYVMRLKKIEYSLWDLSGKYVLGISFIGIFFMFPYKVLLVQWNLPVLIGIDGIARVLFLCVLVGYQKFEGEQRVSYGFAVFIVAVFVFTMGNVFEVIGVYVSLLLLIVISSMLFKDYKEKIQKMLVESMNQKIDTCTTLFVIVLVLLGAQCQVFIMFPAYSELESLNIVILSGYIIYLQWTTSFSSESINKHLSRALQFPFLESEMISLPSNLN